MKRLSVYKENNKLLISDFSLYSSFEDFVSHLMFKFMNEDEVIRKKLKKEYNYSIEFDEKSNSFNIVFDGEKYYISFDEEEIRKFKQGIYNDITFELKRLMLAFEKRKKKEEEKYIEEKEEETKELIRAEENKVIKDGKNGIFINDDAKRFYLEYLKEQQSKKDSISLELKKSFLGWVNEKEVLVPIYDQIRHTYIGDLGDISYSYSRGPKIGEKFEKRKWKYSPLIVFIWIAILVGIIKFWLDYSLMFLGIGIGIDAIANCAWAISHFISIRIKKRKEKVNNKALIEQLEDELGLNKNLNETKSNYKKFEKDIDRVIDRLKNIDNKDKILILEKLKRVLELSSLNNSNAMLRLNIIKENLKYFEQRENAYMADKTKRKVLKPNSNITKKTFTRG